MGWTTKTQIITAATLTGTPIVSSKVTLKSDETAHVQVLCDFPGTPGSTASISLQTTQDDTAETWDNNDWVGFTTIAVPNSPDPAVRSFTVKGCYAFRVVVTRVDGSDSIVCNAYTRKNGNYTDCTLDI